MTTAQSIYPRVGIRYWLVLLLAHLAFVLTYYYSNISSFSVSNYAQFASSNDTKTYFIPWENVLKTGRYEYVRSDGEIIWAGRLPYYGMPYFIFRVLSAPAEWAALLQSLFQILLSASASMAILVHFKLIKSIGKANWKNKIVQIIGFACVLTCQMSFYGSYKLLPEGMAFSLLVFAWLSADAIRKTETPSFRQLAWLGFLLSWALLLRPFVLPLAVLFPLYATRADQGFGRKGLIWPTIKRLFCVGFVAFLVWMPWPLRNIVFRQQFVPYQVNVLAGYLYPESQLLVYEYLRAWGGNEIDWEFDSPGCYLNGNGGLPCYYTVKDLPDVALAGRTCSQFEQLRDAYQRTLFEQHDAPSALRDSVRLEFRDMTTLIRTKSPATYFLYAPLRRTWNLLRPPFTYFIPVPLKKGIYAILLKFIQSIHYIYFMISLFGSFFFMWSRRSKSLLVLSISILLAVALATVVFRTSESRYLISFSGLMCLLMIYFTRTIFSYSQKYPHTAHIN